MAAVLLLTGARLIDGTGHPPVVADVLTDGSTIGAVGPAGSLAAPAGARIVRLAGRTIVPGLIDLHVHSTFPSDMRAYLEHGVTSIRYAGIDQPSFRTIQDRVARGDPPGPRLFTLGPMLDREPPSWPEWSVTIDSPESARSTGRRLLEEEATDGLVATQGIRPEDLRAIVEVAHEHDRPVMGQLWRTDAAEAAEAGIDQLDNTARIAASKSVRGDALWDYRSVSERAAILSRLWLSVDWDETERLMAAMVRRDVAYCPTLIALEQQAGLHPDIAQSEPGGTSAFGEEELRAWAAFEERVRANWSAEDARNRSASLEMRREWIRRFHAMGGRVLVGTDMQFGGPAMHREMAILRDIGLRSSDVIAAATGGAARAMRVADRLGTIEAGKLADMVVVDSDPLVDLAALMNVELVVRDGEVVAGRLMAAALS